MSTGVVAAVRAGEPLVYAYFPGVDEAAHSDGTQSDRFREACSTSDRLVARLLDARPGDQISVEILEGARREIQVPVAGAVDDRGVFLLHHHLLGFAEVVQGRLLERQANLVGDHGATGQDRDVLQHGLATVTEARRLHSGNLDDATDGVDDERGERLALHGMTILNDCYNSNPDAVRAMIDVLADTPARRRVAVLGEMLELGRWTETLHREVGEYAARAGVNVLVGIRGAAAQLLDAAKRAGLPVDAAFFFDDAGSAGQFLKQIARPGDAILLSGTLGDHGMAIMSQRESLSFETQIVSDCAA